MLSSGARWWRPTVAAVEPPISRAAAPPRSLLQEPVSRTGLQEPVLPNHRSQTDRSSSPLLPVQWRLGQARPNQARPSGRRSCEALPGMPQAAPRSTVPSVTAPKTLGPGTAAFNDSVPGTVVLVDLVTRMVELLLNADAAMWAPRDSSLCARLISLVPGSSTCESLLKPQRVMDPRALSPCQLVAARHSASIGHGICLPAQLPIRPADQLATSLATSQASSAYARMTALQAAAGLQDVIGSWENQGLYAKGLRDQEL